MGVAGATGAAGRRGARSEDGGPRDFREKQYN
jgi:hypothetical protein